MSGTRMGVPALMLVLALGASRDAGAGESKAVEKAVKAQVQYLFAFDNQSSPYGDDVELTTGVAQDGVLDASGFTDAVHSYVMDFAYVQGAKVKNLKAAVAGASAWAAFTVHVDMVEDEMGDAPASFDLRANEVLAKIDGAWKVVAGHWSRATPDKTAKGLAQQGQLVALTTLRDADVGPAEIVDDLGAVLRNGTLAARVSARADVAVFSSDAAKPRLGGKKTQKAWKAWWAAVKVDGAIAGGATPDGGVGWLAANLAVSKGKDKGAYQIPARIFLVVTKEAGVWNVVGGQISVPTP